MLRHILSITTVLLVVVSLPSFGQPTGGTPGEEAGAAPGEATSAGQTATPRTNRGSSPQPAGDVVYMKGGREIRGQVSGEVSGAYEVELRPGITVSVPISLVERVEYDEYDPREAAMLKLESNEQEATVIASMKLGPVLSRKLNTVVTEEPLELEAATVVEVFEKLAEMMDVNIVVGDGVRNLPEARIAWDGEIPVGETLYSVLQDHIGPRYEADLEIAYNDETILVRRPGGSENEAAGTEGQQQGRPVLNFNR